MHSMADFIGDVAKGTTTFESFAFPKETDHYHLFNYLFVNFNYTPLLDDYIYRDPQQFQPQAHNTLIAISCSGPTQPTFRAATETNRPVGRVTSAARSSTPRVSSLCRGRYCSGSTPLTTSTQAETPTGN